MRKRWTPRRAVPGRVADLSILNYLSNDTRSLLSPGQCPSIWKNPPARDDRLTVMLIDLELSTGLVPGRPPRLGRSRRPTAEASARPRMTRGAGARLLPFRAGDSLGRWRPKTRSVSDQGRPGALDQFPRLVGPGGFGDGEEHQAEPPLALGVAGQPGDARDDVSAPHAGTVFDLHATVELELQAGAGDAE